jgi:hypothetical protein
MFPMTITLHSPAQLNAVMAALAIGAAQAEPTVGELTQIAQQRATTKAEPKAKDFADPAVGKAYEEATTRVQANEKAKEAAAQVEKSMPAKTEHAANTSLTAEAGKADAPATKAAATSDAPGKEVTYQDAAAAIVKLSKKSRDKAVAVLKQFGASKLPEVAPEKFPDVIAAANEAMKEAA